MKIIDEILPKVKAEVRLDKDNKTLWIKTDTLEGYGRIIIEDGANWCRIFYEECGECAHNDAEQTEPIISKMEQVDKDINVRSKDEPQTCDTCKYGEDKHKYAHICNECGVGINNYTPQTETKTETKNSNLTFEKSDCPWK